jgi:LAO/AO transport system kinase
VTSAMRLFGQHGHPDHAHHNTQVWHPQVIQLSALKGEGLERFWQGVSRFRQLQQANGRQADRRRQQAQAWMWERIEAGLKHAFRHHPRVRAMLPRVLSDVTDGRLPASIGARRLLDAAQEPGPGPD